MRTIIKAALLVYFLAWCVAAEPMLDAHGAVIACLSVCLSVCLFELLNSQLQRIAKLEQLVSTLNRAIQRLERR